MWIILLFLCVSVLPRSNGQETRTLKQNSYTNREISEDFERAPITLTIRSGKNENIDRSAIQDSEYPQYYSRDWDNLRVGQSEYNNNNRDSVKFVKDNDRSIVQNLFFRRPDTETNNASTPQFIRRDEFPAMPVPILYFQGNPNTTSSILTTRADQVYEENRPNESIPANPENINYDLYRFGHTPVEPRVALYNPSHSSLNLNDGSFKPEAEDMQIYSSDDQRYIGTVSNERTPVNVENSNIFSLHRNYQNDVPTSSFDTPFQYSLNSSPKNLESDVEPEQSSLSAIPTNPDSVTLKTSQGFTKPLSTENRPTEQIIPTSMNIYSQRFLQPMVPAYFPPYHFLPYQQAGTFSPRVPYLRNSQTFDRETGIDAGERISEVPEKQTSQITPENLPSETTVRNIPPPLPYPEFGAPFMPYPLPFAPPILLNNPPINFPFGVQARNLAKENEFIDESSLPVVPLKPESDIVPVLPSIRDSLIPEEQTSVIAEAEVSARENLPVEEPTPSKTPYAFGFDMNDGKGNDQHRNEVSDISGVVTGSYGFSDARGQYRMVHYVADKNGFRAFVKSNEPGVASSSSADVVVVAERPPLKAIGEGGQELESLAVPVPETELIPQGTILPVK